MVKNALSVCIVLAVMTAVFAYDNSESEYGKLTKVGDKLYEVTFDKYLADYGVANAYYSEKYKDKSPECTCVYKDGLFFT